jgi:Raf kinase inhibitor-like YbhB/YbcL family protein
MKIFSPNFGDNMPIPRKFTSDGENIHPAIEVHEVPKEAKWLGIVMQDTDSPAGGAIHWVVWHISIDVGVIQEGKLPKGATEGENSFGKIGYRGPAPFEGGDPHTYRFTVYALRDDIAHNADTGLTKLLQQFEEKKIVAEWIDGTYQRLLPEERYTSMDVPPE